MTQSTFFNQVYQLMMSDCPLTKMKGTRTLYHSFLENPFVTGHEAPIASEIKAGLLARVELVEPKRVSRRSPQTPLGKAALIHAILHIEYNAINIALDALYRFRDMPIDYYYDWLKVAVEEAYHYHLLEQYLTRLGYSYGDFPAHGGLWEMVEKTGYDVLVRMALVPRLLEARGLDVTPDIAARLKAAGDTVAYEILQIIFQDELGHVSVGNRWYHYLCEQRNLDPLSTFETLLQKHAPTYLRRPFRIDARKQAGFTEKEMDLLHALTEPLIIR
ncbi:MAG TPA: ferritin-like domain-containing protein [Candidatus Berkiella sp.]|nr:ferritin-like domain-containing protein [Candidatus Berkiella sp.]